MPEEYQNSFEQFAMAAERAHKALGEFGNHLNVAFESVRETIVSAFQKWVILPDPSYLNVPHSIAKEDRELEASPYTPRWVLAERKRRRELFGSGNGRWNDDN